MPAAPKPVKFVASAATPASPAAAPMVLVGSAQVASVTAANGSDAATTQTLANANKATLNALLVALRNAGIIVP